MRRRGADVYAIRNLLRLIPELKDFPRGTSMGTHLQRILGPHRAVRAILFDKVPGANWRVSWHQDISVPVEEQLDVPGFDAWSTKAGVLHANAPAAVLENMLALRLHLDDCGPENAPLQVLPGSHRHGRVTANQIEKIVASTKPVSCTVNAGDVLLMRPLLLHASSQSAHPQRRRVIHLELAAGELPGGLRWGMA